MKKTITFLFSLLMVLLFAACGSQTTTEESKVEDEAKIEQTEASETVETKNTMRYSTAAMEKIDSLGKTIENEQIVLLKAGSLENMDFVWYRVYIYENGINLREENYYFVVEGATEDLLSIAATWDENGSFTTSDDKSLTIYEEEGWLVTTKESTAFTWSGNPWQQDYDYLKENPDIGKIIE
ncbi:MAG: hypothetical protein U0L12_04055 [Ruminococcus sp.]|nr:hypothetical protein [Ruminococcus sp.]